MLTKVLTGVAALVIVIGILFIVLHHGSTTPTTVATTTPSSSTTITSSPGSSSTSAPTTTSTSTSTVPVTVVGPTIPLSNFSPACNQALAPARAVLALIKSGHKISQAEVDRISTSANRGFKVCNTAEYNTFISLELDPYLVPTK